MREAFMKALVVCMAVVLAPFWLPLLVAKSLLDGHRSGFIECFREAVRREEALIRDAKIKRSARPSETSKASGLPGSLR